MKISQKYNAHHFRAFFGESLCQYLNSKANSEQKRKSLWIVTISAGHPVYLEHQLYAQALLQIFLNATSSRKKTGSML